jgi:Pentapeptide repeats (8 copies)
MRASLRFTPRCSLSQPSDSSAEAWPCGSPSVEDRAPPTAISASRSFGGGLALSAGYLVSRAVFVAQARIDRELCRTDKLRRRDDLRIRLSTTESMPGADLREAPLGDVILRHKNLSGANLRGASLEGATIDHVSLDNASMVGATMRGATIGVPGYSVGMIDADLTDADLSNATLIADLRRGTLRGADLRGADLRRAMVRHPHPEKADPDAIEREATDFEGARYDERTRWPDDFDPSRVGAVLA